MKNFCVGTEDGLITLHGDDKAWERQPGAALKGQKVLCGKKLEGRLVASCYGDGIYISDNSGVSWRPVDDNRLKKVRCLEQAPWNGQEVLFAGTEPVGLYASTDQGNSWNEIAPVRQLHEKRKWTYPVPGVDPHIRDVVVDDADNDTLYVAVQVGGILVGQQQGTTWGEIGRGLNLDVHRVVIEPSDRSIFYAATGEEGIFISRDQGQEWRRCGGDIPWTYTIPFETWGANRLIAGMGRDLPNHWNERETGAEAVLILTKDGGKTWSTIFPEKPLASMIMALMFTSREKNSVFVGTGITIGANGTGTGEIYHVDLNNGVWTQVHKDLPGINFIMEV